MEILLLLGLALLVISFLKMIKKVFKLVIILVAILFIVSYFTVDPDNVMGVPSKAQSEIGVKLL